MGLRSTNRNNSTTHNQGRGICHACVHATTGGGASLRFGVVEGELSWEASVCACAAVREGEDGTGECMTRVGDGEAGGVR